jgi:threonine dehydrogenase-like Zn-dependent dehydrogenase
MLGTDRPHVLREAIMCCRKGGTLSIPGVYIGLLDKLPFGAAMNKGLTMKMGQTHMHRYMGPLLERIRKDEIDPSFVVTHRMKLEDAPGAYKTFRDKKDGCIKVVLKPMIATPESHMQTPQTVPLKMYRSTELLTVAAPMVGLGAEDIGPS